jgi:sRNA-binding carbon storage regulator CsrA
MERLIEEFNALGSFQAKLVALRALAGQVGAKITFQKSDGPKAPRQVRQPVPQVPKAPVAAAPGPLVQVPCAAKTPAVAKPKAKQQHKKPENLDPSVMKIQAELEAIKGQLRESKRLGVEASEELLAKRKEVLERLFRAKVEAEAAKTLEQEAQGGATHAAQPSCEAPQP